MNESEDKDIHRDEAVSTLYKALDQVEPPERLNKVIQAAALDEVQRRKIHIVHQRNRRWAVPLSAAAVLVISVSLVTLMQQEAPQEFELQPDVLTSPGRDGAGFIDQQKAQSPASGPAPLEEITVGKEVAPPRKMQGFDDTGPPISAPASVAPAQPESEQLRSLSDAEESAGVVTREASDEELRRLQIEVQRRQRELSRRFHEEQRRRTEIELMIEEEKKRKRARSMREVPQEEMSALKKKDLGEQDAVGQTPSRDISPAVTPADDDGDGRTPEAWLDDILTLYARGEQDAARAQLEKFKQRYPSYSLERVEAVLTNE